jgi:hypothetical protein
MREAMGKASEHSISHYEKIIEEIVCCFYIKGYNQEHLMSLGMQYVNKLLVEYDLSEDAELIKSMLKWEFRLSLQNLMEQAIHRYFEYSNDF